MLFSGQEQEVFSFPVHESHAGSREDDGAISSVGGVTAAVSSTLKAALPPRG